MANWVLSFSDSTMTILQIIMIIGFDTRVAQSCPPISSSGYFMNEDFSLLIFFLIFFLTFT